MPVFTSRFSSNRVASANLQQIRSRSIQANERVETNTTQRAQIEQTRGSNDTQQTTTRVRETLLVRTQSGQQTSQRLQDSRATQTNNTGSAEQQTQNVVEQTEQQTNNRSNIQSRLQTPPGVGATRTRADDNIERPGRLNPTPANPIIEQQLSGFARLRAVASGVIPQTNNSTRDQQSANGLTNRVEARARFLASNGPQPQGRAVGQQLKETQTLPAVDTPITIQAPTATQPTERPTAEDISRANTTQEIRESLRDDAGEIARGLTRDGTRQLQQTTQETAQITERAAENQRSAVQTESRNEVRELQTQERQLSRELQQTQQGIRQERLRAQQAQSSASRSTTSTAAAIGTNVNILAG
ncbi:MAG: hypothetical protein ACI8V2_004220 [Candidatus Latescibacterota bacterium]|jgi:hypothetical protein